MVTSRSAQSRTAVVNARHVSAETRRTGPAPCWVVSRMSTALERWPASTHPEPPLSLWVDFRQGIAPTSTHEPPPLLLWLDLRQPGFTAAGSIVVPPPG